MTTQQAYTYESGARWLRCDLHVHTPFDREKNFGENIEHAISDSAKGKPQRLAEIANKFVNACKEAANGDGLDLVALTDHNSIEGYRHLKPQFDNLARRAGNEGTRMPVIIPGVEFTIGAERPIHCLVIFSLKTDVEDIEGVIRHIFGASEPFNPKTGTPQATGSAVIDFIDRLYKYCHPESGERDLQFVLLPAHADGNRGLAKETGVRSASMGGIMDEMKGHLRQLAITRRDWHGFETKHPFSGLSPEFQDLLARWEAGRRGDDWGDLSRDERRRYEDQEHWPLIESSDPSTYEDIGTRFSWLKMGVLDVEGIRLALLDPQSRLRRMENGPPDYSDTRLQRITVKGTDFFEDIEIPLSSCLTTLIGGRGSGKSTIIEYLRHALDRDRKEDFSDESDSVHEAVQSILSQKGERDFGHSEGTLLPDHQISVEIVVGGRLYRICRSSSGIEPIQDSDHQNPQPVPLDVRSLIQPRILSQRQIAQIARDPASQRRELDTLIDRDRLREIEERRGTLVDTLGRQQLSRKRLAESKANFPAVVTDLQRVRDQISFFEDKSHKEVFARFGELEQERIWLDDVLEELKRIESEMASSAESIEEPKAEKSEPQALKSEETWLYSVADRIRKVRHAAIQALQEQAEALDSLRRHIRSERSEKWQTDYEQAKSEYDVLIEEMESEGARFVGYEKLLQRRVQLERKESSLDRIDRDLEQVERKIRDIQLELKEAHEERLNAREELARSLEEVDADVRFEIVAFGDRHDFEARQDRWFSGAGLRERDWQVLCDYVFSTDGEVPDRLHKLLKAIRTDVNSSSHYGKAVDASNSKVASLVGRDSLTKHFFNALMRRDNIRLDEMERFLPEDLVRAKVRARDGSFKNIESGSIGEKSTAILSLLLLAGNHPIVIDQPEDDLDNQYVYSVVVDLMRRRKFDRQIIVSTHNANIPVNGDAELIVALGTRNQMGRVLKVGSIERPDIKDLVTRIMEGSAEAFRLRRERYGY